jgi:hypothetical protein
MALMIDERARRRMAGMERVKNDTTATGKVHRIHRALTTGRPPVSEMKSPTAAIGAARSLIRSLEREMDKEGLDKTSVKYGVAIAYVSPDLTALGYTSLWGEDSQDAMLGTLAGNVPLGLLFGISETADLERVLVGARPFLNTKQTDEWLSELVPAFPLDIADPA